MVKFMDVALFWKMKNSVMANEKTFQEVWEGDKRKESYEFIRNKMNAQNCRENCRMDEINRYLWELDHPSAHVNFI